MWNKIKQNKIGWFIVVINYYSSFAGPSEFWSAICFWIAGFISFDLIVVKKWFDAE